MKQSYTELLFAALAIISAVAHTKADTQSEILRLTTGGMTRGVIVGDNDFTVVSADGDNIPEAFRPFLDAFGQTTFGCSATHIGNSKVLMAAHCYSPSPRTTPGACRGVTIWWGNRGGKKPFLVSQCQKILFRELSSDRDVMLVQVDKAPPVSVVVDTKNRPPLGAGMTIFSHPRARPLEWSGFCAMEDWAGSSKGKDQFNHQCDTEPGSSGAAIMDAVSGHIIGIHNGGGDGWNYATFSSLDALDTLLKK